MIKKETTDGRLFLFYKNTQKTKNSHNILIDVTAILHLK